MGTTFLHNAWRHVAVACTMACLQPAYGQSIRLTTEELKDMYSTINMQRTSVHDPSIVFDEASQSYYIFGSHNATAKTTDLQNWSPVTFTWGAVNADGTETYNVEAAEAFHVNQTKEIRIGGQTVAFGNYDASAWNCALPGTDNAPWSVYGNMWAPDIIYNPAMKKWCQYLSLNGPTWNSCIILLTADRIEGPWSEPVRLDVTGIDPGHVVGEDGKRYLFVDKGYVVPLSDDGLRVTGGKKKVYDGWQWPRNWKTEGNDMYLESPKLTFHDGYYYLVSAEGGTAGPATSHMAVVARSKSIFGPWENSPYNPLVHTYSAKEPWWSKGHGTLVDDADGQWWIVYHAYAPGYHTLGRQTLIDPVEWTADGWLKLSTDRENAAQPESRTETDFLSDDFRSGKLGLQWAFWKEYAPEALSFGEKGLTVEGKGKTPADGRLLTVTPTDKSYEVETEITLGKRAVGGLLLYYNERKGPHPLPQRRGGGSPPPRTRAALPPPPAQPRQPPDRGRQHRRADLGDPGRRHRRVRPQPQQLRRILCPPPRPAGRREGQDHLLPLHLPERHPAGKGHGRLPHGLPPG